jgi:retron-type reverse transcriptase
MATTTSATMAFLTQCQYWNQLTFYDNLLEAEKKARKRKSKKQDVIQFEKDLENNLLTLQSELQLHSYQPKQLVSFVIHDPKTRVIRKSDFRDRIVHHAICNIIQPIFEKTFIYDSFANQKGKGTHKAIDRFNQFSRKVSKNHTKSCYVLKGDIKHYFEEVNHDILMNIIKQRIKDKDVLWLIKKVLNNHKKGIPLGNLTSQVLANVYLNELDHYVKHILKVKHYIRYVDDFVILSNKESDLINYKKQITLFLKNNLDLELHQGKSKILKLNQGISFLGFRLFKYHKLLRKSNIRTMRRRINNNYDKTYTYLQGWNNYASFGNTFNLRSKTFKQIESKFQGQIASAEIDRLIKLVC